MSEITVMVILVLGIALFVGGFYLGMKLKPAEVKVERIEVPKIVHVEKQPEPPRETGGRVRYDPDQQSRREADNSRKIAQIMQEAEY